MKTIGYLFAYIFLISMNQVHSAHAELVRPYSMTQLDSRRGLSNSAINALFQDSDHLLWAATWDGLNVFDGSAFRVFNHNKENLTGGIGNNVILQVLEDRKGIIWISTIEGVTKYIKSNGKFSNYLYRYRQNKSVGEQEFMIGTGPDGSVYCLSRQNGLLRYNDQQDTFLPVNVISDQKIIKFKFDHNNLLWALTSSGSLIVFKQSRGAYRIHRVYNEHNLIADFYYVNQELLVITGENRLFKIGPNFQRGNAVKLYNEVKDICWFKGHFIIAWATRGCKIFDPELRPSGFMKADITPLASVKINAISTGPDHVLWFGTDGSGIIKLFPEKKNFGLTTLLGTSNSSHIRQVRAFCSIDDDLLVATKGSGIVWMKNFSILTGASNAGAFYQSPNSLDHNAVYALKKGTDHLIYIGSDGKGIGLYDMLNKKFVKWSDITGHGQTPVFGSVYSIIQDPDQSVWLGTSGYGLIHLRISRTAAGKFQLSYFRQYKFTGKDSGPANDIMCHLENGLDNRIWLGCRYSGLSVFDRGTQQFKTLKAFSYPGSLSHNDVLSLYKDSENRMWIGTSYGLNWIYERDVLRPKPVFSKLSLENGLPNNTIHAIMEGDRNQIWISTNRGLARINTKKRQIERYQESDGLQSNEFCDGAVWKNENGLIFFGGIFGLNYFEPSKITSSVQQTNVLISELQLGGKRYNEHGLILLKPGHNKLINYALDRSNNYFDFSVKPINSINGGKSEFAYFLQGYDKDWHYSGSMTKLGYSNIPPGKYTLKLKWSNGEGSWTRETIAFRIIVSGYFWQSWPAITIYACILGLVSYLFYRYKNNKTQMRHCIDMERMLRLKEEEVHQEQLRFFTNVTHELQTPLTLINGSIERFFYKNKDISTRSREHYFLSLVHQQSSRLTYLVNQLLDFRKAEARHLKKQLSYLDISGLLKGIGELFVPLCEPRKLSFRVEVDEQLVGWMDKDKLEKIVFNLLSNAFKHSGPEQQILFAAHYLVHSQHQLQILVSNSGCYQTTEQIAGIFDRLFVADTMPDDKYSHGIGLAFTRQLVEVLGGTITAENINNWISFKTTLSLKADPDNDNSVGNPLTHKPSYLLRSITAKPEHKGSLSAVENNRQALMATLKDDEKKTILIVDDEPAIRFLLKDLLEENYIIYEAEGGGQAIALLEKVTPNLIISDVMMPGINGLELCYKIKSAADTCHIPVILLSAQNSMEQKTEGYDAGADAYIPKPFDTMHLLVRVRKLLEYRQRLNDIFAKESGLTLGQKNFADEDKLFLNKLVKLIEENLDNTELDSSVLEAGLAMSKMQLYRKLKTLSNRSPGDLIKHVRLQHSANLLQATKLTVSEIFYQSGFNNQSYFFREFKKRFQCSPAEYRARQRIKM